MPNSDLYANAFQGLLEQLAQELKKAQQEVTTFASSISGRRKLSDEQRRRLQRKLRKLENDRVISGRGGSTRALKALLDDPKSSSELLIPELARRMLRDIGEHAGRLLRAAFNDGLIEKPAKLWEHLKCTPPNSESDESLWHSAVRLLVAPDDPQLKSVTRNWPGVDKVRIALARISEIVRRGEAENNYVRAMRGAIKNHPKKDKAPRADLAKTGGNRQSNLKALTYLYEHGEYSVPPNKRRQSR